MGADGPGVTLEVVPTAIELPGGDRPAQALVVVRGPAGLSMRGARLSGWAESGIEVRIEGETPVDLKPSEDHAWVVRLTPLPSCNLPTKVHLQLDYTAHAGDEQKAETARVALAELVVKPPHGETVESAADVQVSVMNESINEQSPTQVYVIVTNKTNVPTKASLRVLGPSFLRPQGRKPPVPLAPRQSIVLETALEAGPSVRPGKYLVLFDVLIAWDEAGLPRERHVVSSREITVGVFGESTVLTLFGLPSVFLLPGFLVLLTFETLYRWGFLRSEAAPDDTLLKVNQPAFWVIGITLTGLQVLGYNAFTSPHKNLLEGYGLSDIARLWAVAVLGLGCGGYLSYRTIAWLVRGGVVLVGRLRAWYRSRYTFTADDDPAQALKRLAILRRKTLLPRHRTELEGTQRNVFQLEPPTPGRDRRWVGPGIVYRWTLANSELSTQERERFQRDLRQAISDSREKTNKTGRVASLLQRGKRTSALVYRWENVPGLDGPREIEAARLQPGPATADLIFEEED